jgi:hypothetical protein
MKYLHQDDAKHLEIMEGFAKGPLTIAELLIKRVIAFFHGYEYTSDSSVHAACLQEELQLRQEIADSDQINAEVKALALKALKDHLEFPGGPLDQLKSRYPRVQHEGMVKSGFATLLHKHGDAYMEQVIEYLRDLDALIKELPANQVPGYFVHTPSTPHWKQMREYALSDTPPTNPVSFFGCILSDELQAKVTSFFERSIISAEAWRTTVCENDLTSAASVGVSFKIEYVADVLAPSKNEPGSATWINVSTEGRHYSFYV